MIGPIPGMVHEALGGLVRLDGLGDAGLDRRVSR
jgi:hypothetical protein